MSDRTHTDLEYERELGKLREQLLLMGAKVEEMIRLSAEALERRDDPLAETLIHNDQQINQLEVDIDELCLKLLARRQPVASDLRFITIALKLVTDLERIGDLCVNMCERTLELNREPPLAPAAQLLVMADQVRSMVHDALDAFLKGQAERAREVIARDRPVDELYTDILHQLLTCMAGDPRTIYRATRVQSIAKYLERIGDHATNVAEMVVFMVVGKDIRHMATRETPVGSLRS